MESHTLDARMGRRIFDPRILRIELFDHGELIKYIKVSVHFGSVPHTYFYPLRSPSNTKAGS